MANDNNVLIEFVLEDGKFRADVKKSAGAIDALSNKVKEAKNPVAGLKAGFKEAGSAAGGLAVSVAGAVAKAASLAAAVTAVGGAFVLSKAVDAAAEQEVALYRVAGAMRSVGDYSKEALNKVEAFSTSLQLNKNVADDASLAAFALAKGYNLTNEQATKVVDVAADMSVALGIDLNAAVTQLSASYNGNIGKLAKLNPELAKFGATAFKAGKAVEILGTQFSGAAAAQMQTFSGSVKAANLEFGELLESIGNVIVKNPVILEAIKGIGQVFNKLRGYIEDNQGPLKQLVKEFAVGFIESLPPVILGLSALWKAFRIMTNDISIAEFFNKLATIIAYLNSEWINMLIAATKFKEAVESISFDKFEAFYDKMVKLRDTLREYAEMLGIDGGQPAGFGQGGDKVGDKAGDLGDSEAVKVLKELLKVNEQNGLPSSEMARPPGYDPLEGMTDPFADIARGLYSLADTMGKTNVLAEQGAFIGPPAGAGGAKTGWSSMPPEESDSTVVNMFTAFGKTFGDALDTFADKLPGFLTGGKEGALSAVATAAEQIAKALGASNWVGQLISAVITILGSKEGTKNFTEGFLQALPDIFNNIADNIPEFIDKIIESLPKVLIAFGHLISKLLPGILMGLREGFKGLGGEISEIWKKFWADELPKSMQTFKDAVKKAGQDFSNAINNELPRLLHKWGDQIRDSGFQFWQNILNARNSVNEWIAAVYVGMRDSLAAAFNNLGEWFASLPGKFAAAWQVVWDNIKGAFGQLGGTIADGLKSLRDGIANAAQGFFDKVGQAGQALIDKISGLGGGGGGGGLSKLDPSGWHLATGGMVRGVGKRDTVPAMLTPGEVVIDRTTGPRLNNFLDSMQNGQQQSSGGSDLSMVMLGKIIDILSKPTTVETKVEWQGRTLADMILQLNRTNQRLA